jgi:hypothetical protein
MPDQPVNGAPLTPTPEPAKPSRKISLLEFLSLLLFVAGIVLACETGAFKWVVYGLIAVVLIAVAQGLAGGKQ